MFRRRIFMPLLLVAAAAFACAEAEDDMHDEEVHDSAAAMKVDVQGVGQAMTDLENAYIEAYNGGDAAGVAALFATDGTQSPPDGPSLDPAGIEADLTATFGSGASFSLTIEHEDVIVGEGRAASWGGFTVTVTALGAEPATYNGRYGVVVRQEPDGTWKILRHLFNYENPPPAM